MHNHEFYFMNEQEFDALLENSLPSQAPDDIVQDVTPWREAMDRILVGLALTNVTLNFLLLQYILPAIGYIQIIRGWRTLRRENHWFRAGWLLSIPQAAIFFLTLILNATVWQEVVFDLPFFTGLSWCNAAAEFGTIFCLWGGFRSVQRKAGLPAHAGSAVALMVWYAVIGYLAVMQYSGWLLGLPVLVGYFFILRSLYELSKELDEAGYAIQAAPVRLSDDTLAKAIWAILLIGILCGYLFFGRHPMDWQPVEETITPEQTEIREHLTDLGFPEEILDDLTAEDLAACKGALRVTVDVEELAMNDGREVREVNGNSTSIYTEYDVHELKVTSVAVQLPGDREHWKLIHHFLWQEEPSYRGNEAIQLWPAYREDAGWRQEGGFTGRVLYDEAGQTLASPFYHLDNETYTSDTVFWGQQVSTDVFAAYTIPKTGEHCRGYVSYEILEMRDGYLVDGWANFIHQEGWFQYPVKSAMEYRKTSGWFGNGPFIKGQTALQFYPTSDEPEMIGE